MHSLLNTVIIPPSAAMWHSLICLALGEAADLGRLECKPLRTQLMARSRLVSHWRSSHLSGEEEPSREKAKRTKQERRTSYSQLLVAALKIKAQSQGGQDEFSTLARCAILVQDEAGDLSTKQWAFQLFISLPPSSSWLNSFQLFLIHNYREHRFSS